MKKQDEQGNVHIGKRLGEDLLYRYGIKREEYKKEEQGGRIYLMREVPTIREEDIREVSPRELQESYEKLPNGKYRLIEVRPLVQIGEKEERLIYEGEEGIYYRMYNLEDDYIDLVTQEQKKGWELATVHSRREEELCNHRRELMKSILNLMLKEVNTIEQVGERLEELNNFPEIRVLDKESQELETKFYEELGNYQSKVNEIAEAHRKVFTEYKKKVGRE